MIGAHDTFTYLNAEDLAINIFKPFWKCQKYDPSTLYKKYGADINISFKNDDSNYIIAIIKFL